MTVLVCGQYNFRAGLEGGTGDLFRVAHDQIGGAVSGLAQHVRTCADTDQDRRILLDEGLEVLQICLVFGSVGETTTWRSFKSMSMSGTPIPSISKGLSVRMNSMVLPENASR